MRAVFRHGVVTLCGLALLWPAAGFKDTKLGVSMKLEVRHGATQVYARVQG